MDRTPLRGAGAGTLGVYFAGVAIASSLGGARVFSEDAFASTPRRIADSKFWLLTTSALFTDRPRGASFFALVLFGTVALVVCGSRILWTSAALGHVFSTLTVYSLIALTRLFDPSAFEDLLTHTDIGVSAVCAAWLGAAAAVLWRQSGPTRRAKVAITGACLAIGLLSWLVRSDLTALDSDHLFAFAIGAAVATVPVRALVGADTVYALSAALYDWTRTLVVAVVRLALSRPRRAAGARGDALTTREARLRSPPPSLFQAQVAGRDLPESAGGL